MARWILILSIFEVFLGCLAWLLSEPQGMLANIRVAGKTVEGGSWHEVRQRVRYIALSLRQQMVTLIARGKRLQVPVRGLGIDFSVERAAARAWLAGRELSLWQRLRSRTQAYRYGFDIPIPVVFSEETKLRKILAQLEGEPKNATVELVQGKVIIVPETSGWNIPFDRAKEALEESLGKGQFFVFLPTQPREPTVKSWMLEEVNSLRAEFSLLMTSRHLSAHHNARLAAKALDGVVIFPKETLSLNETIGKRTTTRGFLPAPVLINERRDLRVGGGICPVATAVFVAAAKAGLEIVERHPHSRLVRYAQPGLDATLNYPNKDLKIRNPTPIPVVLRVKVIGRKVLVQVFGTSLREPVRLTVKKQKSQKFLQAVTERVWGGRRETIARSRYRL